MNATLAEGFRQQLLDLAGRLRGDLAGLRSEALRRAGGEASGSLSNAPLHLADLATDHFEQQVAAGLLENQEQVLDSINGALERLDAGTFGVCEECGGPIPVERLRVVPYAPRCRDCEERVEREEGPQPPPT